jgi:hypothetical protein
MTHQLKCWSGSFAAMAREEKMHTIRDCSDRKYAVGDTLILQEFEPEVDEHGPKRDEKGHTIGRYLGGVIAREVTYISKPGSWGLPANVCVMSVKPSAIRR